MTTVRQRRGGRVTEGAEDQPSEEKNVKSDGKVLSDHTGGKLWNILSITLGGIVAIGLGLLTSFYVATLHENDLWFSNIKGNFYSQDPELTSFLPRIIAWENNTALRTSKFNQRKETVNRKLLQFWVFSSTGSPDYQELWSVLVILFCIILNMAFNSVVISAGSVCEVEREISFRTECGLYYSYYKQMIQAASIQQGLHGLVYDNKTESVRTINILERMNVYQEVFLSILYRILPIQQYLEPVYFYIYTLFGLQAVYVFALYVTSWLLSGTWLSGLLAACWYITNRIDTTRVEFTIPLRENWALPFFAVQIAAITYLLRTHLQPAQERLTLLAVFIATFLFSLTWQFNQFMMLIQALALFILDCFDMLPTAKVTWLYIIQISGLLLVCVLQFFNSMILGSLLISFNASVLIARTIQKNLKKGNLFNRLGKLILHVLLVSSLTLLVNKFIKKSLNLESDEHIFKFLKAKFGFGSTRDFDANLYLCEEAFGLLPLNTFSRLSDTLLFYVYIFSLFPLTVAALIVAFRNLSGSNQVQEKAEYTITLKPDAAYNLIHTVLFGCLALSTMRMKYLWTSHMCVFASFGLCSTEVWRLILKCVHLYTSQRTQMIKYSIPIITLLYISYKFWPGIMDELSELREFYDPDTVELMNWIKSNTPNTAVFAGSMQLLAGVKLCTGRTLTNHPHYEDKHLRERTKQIYQIYAKRSPEDVYRILQSFGTDYVILEDSICYERRHSRGCRLRDLLDTANGHIMDGLGESEPDLKPSLYPRFCEEIKKNLPSYTLRFIRVFQNKTFHVYKLAKYK